MLKTLVLSATCLAHLGQSTVSMNFTECSLNSRRLEIIQSEERPSSTGTTSPTPAIRLAPNPQIFLQEQTDDLDPRVKKTESFLFPFSFIVLLPIMGVVLFKYFFSGNFDPENEDPEKELLPWNEKLVQVLNYAKLSSDELNDPCPICLDLPQEGKEIVKVNCQSKTTHRFCRDCLNPWIQRQYTCPLCRAELIAIEPVQTE